MRLNQSMAAGLRGRRVALLIGFVGVLALSACGSSGGGTTPATGPSGTVPVGLTNPGATSNSHVTLTSQTVVLDPSQVKSSLVSVSPDGSTYTFNSDSGPLGDLSPGKVMLLQGSDVALVTSVSHSGSDLVVHTSTVSLPQVIKSGTLHVSAPYDGGAAFGSMVGGGITVPASSSPSAAATATPTASPSASASPSSSASASASSSATASASASNDAVSSGGDGMVADQLLGSSVPGNTLAYQGSSDGFTYKIGYTSKSDGVHLTGDFCYALGGGACGEGLSINGTLDGVLHWSSESADISVSDGKVTSDSMSLNGLSGTVTFDYTTIRSADGSTIGADPPVLKIPFAFEFPVCPGVGCGGVPVYSKVELALLVKLGISARNSSMQGGVSLTFGGSGGVSQSDGGAATGSGSFSISPKLQPAQSITPGASATEFAVQIKMGLGLGIRNINSMLYLSVVDALGQVSGSAVAGEFCQNFTGDFTISGNAEAQLFGFTVASPSKTLYERKASKTQAGC